jgi:hypothetical protein
MSHLYRNPSAAALDALAAALDKAHEYPKRGTPGANAHVQPEWDGVGPVPPGWSSFCGHRNYGGNELWLPEEPETASRLARLTAQEQALLAAARAAAVSHAQASEAEVK